MRTISQSYPLQLAHPAAVEALLDAAFGHDRHRRTAYLLRRYSEPISQLSFAINDSHRLVGTIQCWPVRIGDCRLVLVGPVAVHPDFQNIGIGRALMHAMLEQAAKLGNPAMVMIGDPEYYGRFGFAADATGSWTLPGPWEPHRLLLRNPAGNPLPVAGSVEEDSNAL
jgi:predicted N-acetyltransferase YhbS